MTHPYHDHHVFEAPRQVAITGTRWHVLIAVTQADGTEQEFVASAERFKTEGTATYLVTRDEFERRDH